MNITNLNKANLSKAYNCWYYTIIGAEGDLQKWLNGYEKMMDEQKIGKPTEWYYCHGNDVNREFKLTEKFEDDIVFLLFPIDGLDISRLAVFKIRMNDHWFTDIIDNKLSEQDWAITNN